MGFYQDLVEAIKEQYLEDREALIESLSDMNEPDRGKRIDKSPSTKKAGEMHAKRGGIMEFIDYQNLLWMLKNPIESRTTGLDLPSTTTDRRLPPL